MKAKKIMAYAPYLLTLFLGLVLCSCTDTQPVQTETQSGIDTQAPIVSVQTEQPKTELIVINGVEYLGDETEIDLSGKGEVGYDALCAFFEKLPLLKRITAPDTTLSSEEFIGLCEKNEEVSLVTKVSFEGSVIDLGAHEIDLSEKKIEDKETLTKLLSHVKERIKFVMCDTGLSNEELGKMREKFPHLEFAWRLYMGKWSLRTDDEAFSVMIYTYDYVRMTSEDISVLRYCTNMYALDLGHQAITDLSVIGEMKDLRVLILADNKITDISPLSNLKHLEYLELFVNRVTDLSPLAECKKLVDLNLGFNRTLTDISPIYELDAIERLWLPTTKIPASKRSEITATFPDAQIVYEDVDSVSSGWRTHPRYFMMRAMYTKNKYNPDFIQ